MNPQRQRPASPAIVAAARTAERAGVQQYRQELTANPRRIGHVRRIAAALLRYWGLGELAEPTVMCLTELLSNVHRHAKSDECVLLLEAGDSSVRIVVSDDSAQLPVVREPDWSSESGRGMFLLRETASAWGAERTGDGKDVWVELRPAPREVAA